LDSTIPVYASIAMAFTFLDPGMLTSKAQTSLLPLSFLEAAADDRAARHELQRRRFRPAAANPVCSEKCVG
jgi:hypothetical protein